MKRKRRFKLHIDGIIQCENENEELTQLQVELMGAPYDISGALNNMMKKNEDFKDIVLDAVKEFITKEFVNEMYAEIGKLKINKPSDN